MSIREQYNTGLTSSQSTATSGKNFSSDTPALSQDPGCVQVSKTSGLVQEQDVSGAMFTGRNFSAGSCLIHQAVSQSVAPQPNRLGIAASAFPVHQHPFSSSPENMNWRQPLPPSYKDDDPHGYGFSGNSSIGFASPSPRSLFSLLQQTEPSSCKVATFPQFPPGSSLLSSASQLPHSHCGVVSDGTHHTGALSDVTRQHFWSSDMLSTYASQNAAHTSDHFILGGHYSSCASYSKSVFPPSRHVFGDFSSYPLVNAAVPDSMNNPAAQTWGQYRDPSVDKTRQGHFDSTRKSYEHERATAEKHNLPGLCAFQTHALSRQGTDASLSEPQARSGMSEHHVAAPWDHSENIVKPVPDEDNKEGLADLIRELNQHPELNEHACSDSKSEVPPWKQQRCSGLLRSILTADIVEKDEMDSSQFNQPVQSQENPNRREGYVDLGSSLPAVSKDRARVIKISEQTSRASDDSDTETYMSADEQVFHSGNQCRPRKLAMRLKLSPTPNKCSADSGCSSGEGVIETIRRRASNASDNSSVDQKMSEEHSEATSAFSMIRSFRRKPKKSDTGQTDKSKHSTESAHKCDRCGKTFAFTYALTRHQKRCGVDRSLLKKYECCLCEKVFYTPEGLKRHHRTCGVDRSCHNAGTRQQLPRTSKKGITYISDDSSQDMGDKTYQPQRMVNKEEEEKSVETHSVPENKHQTLKALQTSNSRKQNQKLAARQGSKYVVLKKSAAGKIYECHVCGKCFKRADSLTVHMRVHTGDRPFQCKFCDASYKVSSHLSCHVRAKHSTERPYRCDRCSKSFAFTYALTRHQKRCGVDRSLLKKYECFLCEKVFYTPEGLKRHHRTCGIDKSDLAQNSLAEEKPYKCENCGKLFAKLFGLDRHRRFKCGKETKTPYICQECGKTFVKKNRYHIHVRHHTGERPFKCSLCEDAFCDPSTLKKHQDRHTENKKHVCLLCDASFFDSRCLSLHLMRVHCGIKPYKCQECKAEFSSGYRLSRHIRRVHRKEKKFKCCICSKTFFESHTWLKHMETHTNQPQQDKTQIENMPATKRMFKHVICKLCSETFSMKDLRAHIVEKHAGLSLGDVVSDPIFRCSQCPKEFLRPDVLRMHEFRHKGEKPFPCDKCGSTFSSKGTLRIHQRVHTNYCPHLCSVCGKKFRWQASLSSHIQTHHFQQPIDMDGKPIRYTCKECGKEFDRKMYLQCHMKYHKSMFPFICAQCGKRCITMSRLKIHMSTHEGPKPFNCDTCGVGFFYQYLLKNHLNRKHKKGPLQSWLCSLCGRSLCSKYVLQNHMRLHAKNPDGKIKRCRERGVQPEHNTPEAASVAV
ncbi:hypothetical protein BaRGS_00016529 [Batillaria attramentaria]|uniref:C2H2-type domain-containing protein n=1 Tax=Batillaria attramentaria TaxID=370345 RepID=A0ABD0KYK4_9CAEN